MDGWIDPGDELDGADYWKSNDRKFCDFCKCWIADNAPSIAFHENGKRHKEAVSKRISEISRTSAKNERDQQKMDIQLRKMEEAARAAYAEDISRNGDISSQDHNRALAAAAAAGAGGSAIGPSLPGAVIPGSSGGGTTGDPGRPRNRQVDPLALPMEAHEIAELEARRLAATRGDGGPVEGENPTLWCETVSEEGHTYYWNVKTNETVWEKPKQGYLTLDEYNNIMDQSKAAQEEHARKEKKFLVDNADELAAKFNREKLKQRREEYEAKQREAKRDKEREQDQKQRNDRKASNRDRSRLDQDTEEDDRKSEEDQTSSYSANYSAAAPFGKWQTVEVQETRHVDLQLPEPAYERQQYVAAVVEEPKPKVFKEKVVTTLDKETTAGDAGVFKKRKINITLKKNSRQRIEDY